MSESNEPHQSSDYSWALGPKDVPPVDRMPARLHQPGAQPPVAQPAPPQAGGPAAPVAPVPPSQRPVPSAAPTAARPPAGPNGPAPARRASTGPLVGQPLQHGAAPTGAGRPAVPGQPAHPGQPVPAGTWQPGPGRDATVEVNTPLPESSAGAPGAYVPGGAPGAYVPGGAAGAHVPGGVPGGPTGPGATPGTFTAAPPTIQGQFTPQPLPAPAAKPNTPKAPRPTAKRAPAGTSSGGRVGLSQELRDEDVSLDELLRYVAEVRASDLHLTKGAPPTIRRDGGLKPIDGHAPLEAESLRRSVYQVLTQKQREKFEEELELDFAYQVPGGARFRVNLYQQREALGAAFRLIPSEIKPLEDLGVPAVVGSFANIPRGLVLVTGPTGSGKSTTLASVIDLANRNRPDHIMTVEDPIEFLHQHKRSIVNQREVGEDTKSFASALKHVLRQDPDIILVGEMRDLETISVALTAAETGHLVFATLHTQDAAQTIDRVIDVFPPSQQDQIRVQLAATIQGVVCQTLCKRADGPGRVVATEIMVATPAIRNLIREGKTHQIYSSMQAGAGDGMHSMDQHLADLTKQGIISYETGLEKCQNVADFNRLTGRGASTVGAGIANAGMGGNLEAGGNF